MTITLYLQKETLLRDLQTLQHIFQYNNIEMIEELKPHYKPLQITTWQRKGNAVAIQVTAEEFALIGVFNGGI